MNCATPLVLIRGGGDLATGVAVRLHRCGFHVVITEIKKPLAVRRLVAFAQAVYASECLVEDVRGRLAANPSEANRILEDGDVPVMVDPPADYRDELNPSVLVDARMRKVAPRSGWKLLTLSLLWDRESELGGIVMPSSKPTAVTTWVG